MKQSFHKFGKTDGLTQGRYRGKICGKHPGLSGLRFKSNKKCVGCVRTSKTKRRKDTKYADSKKQQQRLRELMFVNYGERCGACGEDDKSVLTFDHINHDGANHKRALTLKGLTPNSRSIHWGAKKSGFPPIFRTLCHNCNWRAHLGFIASGDISINLPGQLSAVAAIRKERLYGDNKHGPITGDGGHNLAGWLLLAEAELLEAKHALIKGSSGRDSVRAEIVQIAAICVAALEQHGLIDPHDGRQI